MNEAKPNRSNKEFSVTVGAGGGDETLDVRQEVIEPEQQEKAEPKTEPEPEKEIPIEDVAYAQDFNEITVDGKDLKTDDFIFKGKKYKIEYYDMPWEVYNKIVEDVAIETRENPIMSDRLEHMKCLKWSIQRIIVGDNVKKSFSGELIASMSAEFGEALRRHIFGHDGKNEIDRQMLGNLMERSEPLIKQWTGQGKPQRTGRR